MKLHAGDLGIFVHGMHPGLERGLSPSSVEEGELRPLAIHHFYSTAHSIANVSWTTEYSTLYPKLDAPQEIPQERISCTWNYKRISGWLAVVNSFRKTQQNLTAGLQKKRLLMMKCLQLIRKRLSLKKLVAQSVMRAIPKRLKWYSYYGLHAQSKVWKGNSPFFELAVYKGRRLASY